MEDFDQITDFSSVSDADWFDWSSLFGWYVRGIWPKSADGTDINTVHTNKTNTLIATGDDDNLINIFRYPAYAERV